MNSVKELADALVADGRYFPSRGDGDTPLGTYHAGEYQLTVVDAFETAAEQAIPVSREFQQAALDLIVNRPNADELDVEDLTLALEQIRANNAA